MKPLGTNYLLGTIIAPEGLNESTPEQNTETLGPRSHRQAKYFKWDFHHLNLYQEFSINTNEQALT